MRDMTCERREKLKRKIKKKKIAYGTVHFYM